MGICTSPDIAQEHISKILKDVLAKDVVVYIDNLAIWSDTSYEEHLELFDRCLQQLQDGRMRCNPLKCSWAVQENNFLGHYMRPDSIRPMKKNIDAILKTDCPHDVTQARSFIGAVKFYKSLYPCRAHVLTPLSDLTVQNHLFGTRNIKKHLTR